MKPLIPPSSHDFHYRSDNAREVFCKQSPSFAVWFLNCNCVDGRHGRRMHLCSLDLDLAGCDSRLQLVVLHSAIPIASWQSHVKFKPNPISRDQRKWTDVSRTCLFDMWSSNVKDFCLGTIELALTRAHRSKRDSIALSECIVSPLSSSLGRSPLFIYLHHLLCVPQQRTNEIRTPLSNTICADTRHYQTRRKSQPSNIILIVLLPTMEDTPEGKRPSSGNVMWMLTEKAVTNEYSTHRFIPTLISLV